MKVINLSVKSEGKNILKDVNIEFGNGKVYALVGSNGSGKSTLANAIMGNPKYEKKGKILFYDKDISNLSIDKRAKLGMFMSFQNPVEIQGVSVSGFLRTAYNSVHEKKLSVLEFQEFLEKKAQELDIDSEFLNRNINENFSGGEKKKMEMLQMLVLNPKFIILDEIDSGLDEKSRDLISSSINGMKSEEKTFLIITHYKDFIEKIKPDRILEINNGEIKNAGI